MPSYGTSGAPSWGRYPALPDSVSRRNTWWSADDTPSIRFGYVRGMAPVLPATRRRQHVYDDSQRWERFTPRPDDIFITTPPKSGTTWMQGIVASLLWPHGDAPAPAFDLSPWLDARIVPLDDMDREGRRDPTPTVHQDAQPSRLHADLH